MPGEALGALPCGRSASRAEAPEGAGERIQRLARLGRYGLLWLAGVHGAGLWLHTGAPTAPL